MMHRQNHTGPPEIEDLLEKPCAKTLTHLSVKANQTFFTGSGLEHVTRNKKKNFLFIELLLFSLAIN